MDARSPRFRFLLAYTALCLLEFYAETLLPEQPGLRLFAKPALLTALSLYFFRETRGHRTRRDAVFQTALAFAWLGDVLLLRDDGFLVGLGSFLVMQVLYAVVFWKTPFLFPWKIPNVGVRMGMVLTLFYVLRIFLVIQPNLGGMALPVAAYLLVITTMALMACSRYGRVPADSFWPVAVGAFLFIISDSFIAVEKFDGQGTSWLSWLVMPTYAAAQYLIVEGVLRERVPEPMFAA